MCAYVKVAKETICGGPLPCHQPGEWTGRGRRSRTFLKPSAGLNMTKADRNTRSGFVLASPAEGVRADAGREGEQDAVAFSFDAEKDIIPAPADPALWPAFREALAQWREQTRARLKYDAALYRRADFAWSAGNFACGFLMLCDQTFYNPTSGRYMVDWPDHQQRHLDLGR